MAETKENSLSKAFVGFVLERASAAPKIKDTGILTIALNCPESGL